MQCDWAAQHNRRPCSVVLCETQLGLMDVQLLRRRSAQQTALQPPDVCIVSKFIYRDEDGSTEITVRVSQVNEYRTEQCN